MLRVNANAITGTAKSRISDALTFFMKYVRWDERVRGIGLGPLKAFIKLNRETISLAKWLQAR